MPLCVDNVPFTMGTLATIGTSPVPIPAGIVRLNWYSPGDPAPENDGITVLPLIVIAEDEFLIADVLAIMLEDAGYEVASASHGKAALALIPDSGKRGWIKVKNRGARSIGTMLTRTVV